MKRFFINLFLIGCLCILGLISVVIIRMWLLQPEVQKAFRVRPSTKVLCIGNSHTGCTWEDSEANGIQVMWKSASPLIFHIMRLSEAFRRGGKFNTVVMDCDLTSLVFDEDYLIKEACVQWPLSCKHLGLFPLESRIRLFLKFLTPLSRKWLVNEVPPQSDARFTDLDIEEQDKEFEMLAKCHLMGRTRNEVQYALQLLEQARTLCESHNVRLILFAAPLPTRHPSHKVKFLDEWIEYLRNEGFMVLDYRKSCPDELFGDCHHLSRRGRIEFTKKHLSDLISQATPVTQSNKGEYK